MIKPRSILLAILAVFVFSQPAFSADYYGSIGDFVWNDENWDGIQDDGEPGLGGVDVYLYKEDGTFVYHTTTSSDSTSRGEYSFNDVLVGNHYLEFGLKDGWSFSPPDVDDYRFDSDVIDPDTGRTNVFWIVASYVPHFDAGMHAVPIPGAVWLLGSGLVGLAGLRRRFNKGIYK